MPVDYYVYPEDSASSRVDFQNTVKILSFFSKKFREYPFIREKFGMAEVDGSLTMEHQTLCSIQKNLITGDRKYETTIVHETAHHWFGDFITPLNWKHTWLSEGFATYAEALYIEETQGKDSAAAYVRGWMGNEQGVYAGSVTGRSDTSFWDSFAPRVYNKGALVLHMLRGVTGDSLFFLILRNYLTNPDRAYGNATTEDFIGECERVTGRAMKWFFDQWVYSSPASIDRPEYRYRWESDKDGSGFRTTLHLEQPTADKQFYRMPVTISLVCDGARADTTVDNTLPSQSFSFSTKTRPTDLLIDAGDKIMKIVRKEGSK
jgi:aminopeptidase N